MTGMVYFVRPVGLSGPIKIGHSIDVPGRIQTLSAWAPFELELVAKIEGGTVRERQFHALLREHHSHREWFHPHPEVLAVVDAVAGGRFDIGALPQPICLGSTGKTRRRRSAVSLRSASVGRRLSSVVERLGAKDSLRDTAAQLRSELYFLWRKAAKDQHARLDAIEAFLSVARARVGMAHQPYTKHAVSS